VYTITAVETCNYNFWFFSRSAEHKQK